MLRQQEAAGGGLKRDREGAPLCRREWHFVLCCAAKSPYAFESKGRVPLFFRAVRMAPTRGVPDAAPACHASMLRKQSPAHARGVVVCPLKNGKRGDRDRNHGITARHRPICQVIHVGDDVALHAGRAQRVTQLTVVESRVKECPHAVGWHNALDRQPAVARLELTLSSL